MKQILKQTVLNGVELLGVNRFYRWRTRHRLLGLCYHGVIGDDAPWDDPRTWIAVSATQFDFQMRELARHWQPVSLSEIDRCFRAGEPLPENAVFVTFDDGFLNNLTIAAPILARYGIPATVFLTTGLIGTEHTIWPLELQERIVQCEAKLLPEELPIPDNVLPTDPAERRRFAADFVDYCKTRPDAECRNIMDVMRRETVFQTDQKWQRELYRMLDWKGARQLLERGVDVGAHTVSHCNLARAAAEEAEAELKRSRETIETELGIDCFSVAYPFGDAGAFSDAVVETVRRLGFRIAVTLCLGRNSTDPDPLRLDRLCVTGDLTFASFRSLIAGWRT